MGHKKVETRCFVIDASIARAAGSLASEHPTGTRCREFLQAIRGVCHRIAWNSALKAEWEKHQSAFAQTWLVSMFKLKKVRLVADDEREDIRASIHQHSTDPSVVTAMLKDTHLVEAALESDHRVASLDETVRGHFARLGATCAEFQQIVWVNPVEEAESCATWLESGAPENDQFRLCDPDR